MCTEHFLSFFLAPSILELARPELWEPSPTLGFPSPSSSSIQPISVSLYHTARFGPETSLNTIPQHRLVDQNAIFGVRAREVSALPSDVLGAALSSGPTWAASPNSSNNRPTWSQDRRLPELPRPHAFRGGRAGPDRDLFPLSFLPHHTSGCPPIFTRSAPISTRRAISTVIPARRFQHPYAISNRERGLGNNFRSRARRSRRPSAVSQLLPLQHQAGEFSGSPYIVADHLSQPFHRRSIPLDHDGRQRFPATLTSMSANDRGRSLRPNDLTMPSTPSQPAPSPQQPPSRSSQQEQSQSTSSATKRKREPDLNDDDDLFGDSTSGDIVDLVDKTEVPPDTSNSQEDNKKYVRMSTLDCVICMDSAKDLTVTHCGKPAPLPLPAPTWHPYSSSVARASILLRLSSFRSQHGPK